jgi:CheY-like chemotaxis protein/HPt (histidine-containing phosphotransfer) domain-containing protein
LETILRVLSNADAPVAKPATTLKDAHLPGRVAVPLSILVAEDNDINQRVALNLLERQGHKVVLAGNGIEAVSLWETGNFDLVFMDVQMPQMDGFAATAIIREKELGSGKHTPIVAMTAHAMKGDRERCLAAGMDEYVPKPIQVELLYEVVRMATGRNDAGVSPNIVSAPVPGSSIDTGTHDVNELELALLRLGGDQDLMKEAATMFLNSYPSLLSNVRSAFIAREADSLELATHKLKGSLSNFGAVRACNLAFKLELMGRDAHLDSDDTLVTELEMEVEQVAAAIADLVGMSVEQSVLVC